MRLLLALSFVLSTGSVAATAADWTVKQKDRAFERGDLDVAQGDTVHFVNADDFDHQIFVDDPAHPFDSDEAEPGKTIDETFAAKGTYTVRCRIHPRMTMTVRVH